MSISPRAASWLQVAPFAFIMIALVIVPMLIVFVVSFLDYGFAEVYPEILWANYTDILRSSLTLDLYKTIFFHIAIVWSLTVVLGFTVTYYLVFHVRKSVWRVVFLAACAIPFWTPGPIRMISWVPLLGREGLVNSLLLQLGFIDKPLDWLLFSEFSVLLVYVNMLTLAMIGPMFNSMVKIDKAIVHAAIDQGASEWQIVTQIVIPLVKPGIVIGTIFVVTAIIGDSFVVKMMSGSLINTPGGAIMNEINAFQYPPAAAKSMVMVAVVFLAVGTLLRFVDIRKELAR